jgi:hypothetical protein
MKSTTEVSAETKMTTLAADGAGIDFSIVGPQARIAGQQMITALASWIEILEDPFKAEFVKIKDEVNRLLANLPPTDQVPAANAGNRVLQDLCSLLVQAQAMTNNIREATKGMRTIASIDAEVAHVIETRTKAGELFTKADYEAAINKAKSDAETLMRSKFSDTLKTIAERREMVTKASLPVPSEEVLQSEDFEKFFTEAKERHGRASKIEKLSGEMTALCWLDTKDVFERTMKLAETAASAPAKSGGGLPINGDKPPKPKFML